jgi:hypothetical protein
LQAAGNVFREIKKLISEHKEREDKNQIPDEKKLYAWIPLKVPHDSLEAMEMGVIMATRKLFFTIPNRCNFRALVVEV